MAVLTIRNLDDNLKRELRRRAAEHERSMEEEARVILRGALQGPEKSGEGLGTRIRRLVEAAGGGVELELPPRGPARPLPDIFNE